MIGLRNVLIKVSITLPLMKDYIVFFTLSVYISKLTHLHIVTFFLCIEMYANIEKSRYLFPIKFMTDNLLLLPTLVLLEILHSMCCVVYMKLYY